MTDDTITRARAAVARMREAEGAWLGALSVYPENGMSNDADDLAERICDTRDDFVDALLPYAAPALLRLAEAVGRLAARPLDEGLESPWWAWGECLGCGAEQGPPNGTGYRHADDCPALAIDAALADLAALAGDADAGEVGDA